MTLPIQKDKLFHFGAGSLIGLSAVALNWWALVPVVVIAIGKELWDAQGNGTPETLDAIATIAGGLIVVACIVILMGLT